MFDDDLTDYSTRGRHLPGALIAVALVITVIATLVALSPGWHSSDASALGSADGAAAASSAGDDSTSAAASSVATAYEATDVTTTDVTTVAGVTADAAAARSSGSPIFTLGDDGVLTVAIDPGHGADDSGATTVDGSLHEADLCWSIASACASELTAHGVNVVLTRAQNENPSFEERTQRAVDTKADVLISIHINWNDESTDVSGVTVYYPNGTSTWKRSETYLPGMLLAATIDNNLSTLGFTNQGLPQEIANLDPSNPQDARYFYPNDTTNTSDYLAMIRWPRVNGIPAVLVEHGFLSNSGDAALLADPNVQQSLGASDANAILACYGML